MENKKYISNKVGECPVCGNTELNYFDHQLSDNSIYYRWECAKCKAEGEEWHELHFVGHVVRTKINDEEDDYEDVNDYILPEKGE